MRISTSIRDKNRSELICIDHIRILNPRVRGQRHFQEIVKSIAMVGLKRPITVSPRSSATDGYSYDLICGQGRIEAFLQLGQKTIPAIVRMANENDCLVMSLVENLARRQHSGIDLLRDIGTLRKRGYSDSEISKKIGLSEEYVGDIANLLDRGEERLAAAVEAGSLPLHMAVEIAKSTDTEIQVALTQAYVSKKLRGKKLVTVRRLIEQRQRRGKHIGGNQGRSLTKAKRPLTSDTIVRVYRQEADRQRLLIKRAEVTQGHLLFVVEALRSLNNDAAFSALLAAEQLDVMPSVLAARLIEGPTA